MAFTLTYSGPGRGAFPSSGLGGTLNAVGTALGSYYRAPVMGTVMPMPGLAAALAIRNEQPCSINHYAVFMAVKVLQARFGAVTDGILGPNTSTSIKAYQRSKGITVDGVVGPQTCHALFAPAVATAAQQQDPVHFGMLHRIALGTITVESGWDLGAVGVVNSEDLGLGQINGPSHPSMSVDARLSPATAIPWLVAFIDSNLRAMNYDEDAGIAAYNLGVGGAKSWIAAGRPEMFNGTNVWAYIARIKQGGV